MMNVTDSEWDATNKQTLAAGALRYAARKYVLALSAFTVGDLAEIDVGEAEGDLQLAAVHYAEALR